VTAGIDDQAVEALLADVRRKLADTRTSSRHKRTGRPKGRSTIADYYRRDEDGEYIPDIHNDSNYTRPERLRTLPADIAMAVALELARREGLKGDGAYDRAAVLYFKGGAGRPVTPEKIRTIATRAYREIARGLLDRVR
jgi:hypothetical protein